MINFLTVFILVRANADPGWWLAFGTILTFKILWDLYKD